MIQSSPPFRSSPHQAVIPTTLLSQNTPSFPQSCPTNPILRTFQSNLNLTSPQVRSLSQILIFSSLLLLEFILLLLSITQLAASLQIPQIPRYSESSLRFLFSKTFISQTPFSQTLHFPSRLQLLQILDETLPTSFRYPFETSAFSKKTRSSRSGRTPLLSWDKRARTNL